MDRFKSKSHFLRIIGCLLLGLFGTSLLANPLPPVPKHVTDDKKNIGQTEKSDSTLISRNKSGAGVSPSNPDDAQAKTAEDAPAKPREEIPMMSPANPSASSMPAQTNRLNINSPPPANSQQRMLNPSRPMDSGY
ncbi:hypothetical protein W03_16110 [Nitrosomonas sp. PY1]|uniref:hypothetical protein n=1 Tax=Nitrosomonas sp. PY1 TaxID=1803906 RepID=UPI001FC8D0B6|nr:hypothetical protein [Nitrosomonas sp. PY1]GKS69607.1 hypothetical protein W03_16110 [Nitrosomonas sp. PY1]